MTVGFKHPTRALVSSHIATPSATVSTRLIRSAFFISGLLIAMLVSGKSGAVQAIDLPDFEGLVADKGKAVVKVTVTATSDSSSAGDRLPNFNEEELPEFFKKFFEDLPNSPGVPNGGTPAAGFGSGFILSEDGYIVTNAHVVNNATEITVALPDRREFDAELVGADKRTDVALLKVEGSGLPTLSLGDSDKLKVGQWVLAIGSPFGFEYTATQGIVSALSRSLPNENYVPFIQTDVAVNPGNSGGPLFDLNGDVVGVNSQIYSRSGGYMGLSFAIPVNVVQTVVEQLKDQGFVSRGWLGVVIQDVNRDLAKTFGMNKPAGALIAKVNQGSPAADAGLKPGDIILKFDGQSVDVSSDLPPLVGSTRPGDTVDVELLRNRENLTLMVTIRELKENRSSTGRQTSDDKAKMLGLSLRSMTDTELGEYGVENGLLVTEVDADGVAAAAGIAVGDVLMSYNNTTVSGLSDLRELIENSESGESVALLISRNKNPQFVALTLP
jgi:serine protease Do